MHSRGSRCVHLHLNQSKWNWMCVYVFLLCGSLDFYSQKSSHHLYSFHPKLKHNRTPTKNKQETEEFYLPFLLSKFHAIPYWKSCRLCRCLFPPTVDMNTFFGIANWTNLNFDFFFFLVASEFFIWIVYFTLAAQHTRDYDAPNSMHELKTMHGNETKIIETQE